MGSGESIAEQLVFLGTGTSHGVPMIACDCPVCQSTKPENNRTRSSVVLGLPDGNLLIDTTPEFRMQLLRERIKRIDAVLYTHEHADHLHGLDDLRAFPRKSGHDMPVYCDARVKERIETVFDYAFRPTSRLVAAGGIPRLTVHEVKPGEPFDLLGTRVTPIRLSHGWFDVLGYRIGDLAYCTDVKTIPDESWAELGQLDTLVLGCLRHEPHETHMNLEEALAVVERLRPRQTWLTHISHRFDHDEINGQLPANVLLAHDGLRIPIGRKS
jgi:phosphoribosyl 1,2-cyclic phosphate phosphodiesterase